MYTTRRTVSGPKAYRNPAEPKSSPWDFPIAVVLAVVVFFLFCA